MDSQSPLEPHLAGISEIALPELRRSSLCLVLEQIRSAFNVGALFRTADAAAVESIYLTGLTPHPPQAQLEKTALGATQYVNWKYRSGLSEVLAELRENKFQLVALDNGPGSISLWDFEWPERTALAAGNEVTGCSAELLQACDFKLTVPMFGYKRSLNVTTTLGIAMYDYLRTHRTFCGGQGLNKEGSERDKQQ